jgi:hypothetical protein
MKDIVAMWVVAVALVGAVGVHSTLPDLPPRPGYGVEGLEAAAPQQVFAEPGQAGPVVPPADRPVPTPVRGQTNMPDLPEVLQSITRLFRC